MALLVGIFITSFSHASGLQNPQRQSLDSVVSRGNRTSRSILVSTISIDSDTISIDSSGTNMIFSDGANNAVTLTQLSAAGAGSAPDNATYITQTTNATLDSEQALTSVTSGLLSNDSVTGVISSRTIGGTSNEVDVASSTTAITIGIVDPLIVSKGGTGLTSGTSGGVLGYTASGTLASSTALTANAVIIGGGAGATPTTITADTATSGHYLASNSTSPAFRQIISTDMAGVFDLEDGGTGATTASNARSNLGLGTIATQNSNNVSITGGSITGITDLVVADGGTGASTFTDGGVLIGKGTGAITDTGLLAKGDLVVGDGVTNPTTLTAGANGTILSADSSQTSGLVYATRNSILPVTTKGSIMTYSTKPIELLVGSDGKIISADSSTSNGIAWSYPTGFFDTNGKLWLQNTAISSAVNYVVISNDVTGLSPTIAGRGSDANVGLILSGRGSGVISADHAFLGRIVELVDAATVATDASQGNIFRVTLGGNRTLGTPTNPTNGQKAIWIISQDTTGSRTLTYSPVFRFGTTVTSPTLSTAAGSNDYIGAIYQFRGKRASWDVVSTALGYTEP